MENEELMANLDKAFESKEQSSYKIQNRSGWSSMIAAAASLNFRDNSLMGFSSGEAYRQYMWGRPFDKKPESNRSKKLAAKAEKQRAKQNKA